MMTRFCAYVDKVFPFREPLQQLTDSRLQPINPTSAVFLTAFMMFATHRPSLHALEPDLRLPSRFRGLVGRRVPSVDTVGRVYARLASDPHRDWLAAVAHLLKRNKALPSPSGWYFATFDGHFWCRNLKPAARFHWSTLVALADELYRSLQQPCRAPWVQILPQPP